MRYSVLLLIFAFSMIWNHQLVRAQEPNMPPAISTDSQSPQNPAQILPPPAQTEARGPIQLDATLDPGLRMGNTEGFTFEPTGRRDPFAPPKIIFSLPGEGSSVPLSDGESPPPNVGFDSQGPLVPGAQVVGPPATFSGGQDPLSSYHLRDFKVVAILWDVRSPRAMVRLPNNRVYTIGVKTKMSRENAVVAAIREREVVMVQPAQDGGYRGGEIRVLKMVR